MLCYYHNILYETFISSWLFCHIRIAMPVWQWSASKWLFFLFCGFITLLYASHVYQMLQWTACHVVQLVWVMCIVSWCYFFLLHFCLSSIEMLHKHRLSDVRRMPAASQYDIRAIILSAFVIWWAPQSQKGPLEFHHAADAPATIIEFSKWQVKAEIEARHGGQLLTDAD